MLETRITITYTPKTQQLLSQFGELLRPPVVFGMELTIQVAEGEVVRHTPVDQGTLRASVYGRVVDLWPRIEGHLGSPLIYALPVEAGSAPHWPPPGPIQGWVRRKLGLAGREMVSVAFLIARAISRRGTRGHFMFQRGVEKAKEIGPRLMEAAVERFSRQWSDR